MKHVCQMKSCVGLLQVIYLLHPNTNNAMCSPRVRMTPRRQCPVMDGDVVGMSRHVPPCPPWFRWHEAEAQPWISDGPVSTTLARHCARAEPSPAL